MAIQVYRKYDPDALAADGYIPQNPLCQRCGHEATFENPIGVSFRKSWDPFTKREGRIMDALCARCRDWLATR